MNYPTIRIEGNGANLSFVMTDGFSEGYANKLEGMEWQTTHPMYFWWTGGAFQPIPFVVTLFVDKESPINTSTILENTVRGVIGAALCPVAAGGSMFTLPQQAVTLYVGDWWQRLGYLQDVSVDWKPPWDMENQGRAMIAVLHFTFMPDWLAKDTTNKAFDRLPTASSFKFK